jgi:hypothetical protein
MESNPGRPSFLSGDFQIDKEGWFVDPFGARYIIDISGDSVTISDSKARVRVTRRVRD